MLFMEAFVYFGEEKRLIVVFIATKKVKREKGDSFGSVNCIHTFSPL